MTECHDCGVAPGAWHRPGCGEEQCPYCGRRLVGCGCAGGRPPLDDRLAWSGACPWATACRRLGFFGRSGRGGWQPCRPGDPGAQPDVVRLLRECRWRRWRKRYEPHQRTRR